LPAPQPARAPRKVRASAAAMVRDRTAMPVGRVRPCRGSAMDRARPEVGAPAHVPDARDPGRCQGYRAVVGLKVLAVDGRRLSIGGVDVE
jgi:hypothetical protein